MTRAHPDVPKELERYLVPSEQIIFQLRRHRIVLVGPFLGAVSAFVVAFYVDAWLDGAANLVRNAVFIGAAGVTGYFLYRWLDWHREIFLASDRRLMLVYGILTRKVAIMPMAKVTDMRYDRTIPGQLLGYGKYILESAGQDQALSEINYVPEPDKHYQQISAVIFETESGRRSESLVRGADGRQLPVNEAEHFWFKRR